MRRYDPRTEYRPAGVRVLSISLWALAAFICWGLAAGGLRSLLVAGPWVVLVLVVIPVVLFWLPRIEVDDAGVTVTNVFTRVRVPFGCLVAVETRFGLTLLCSDDKAVGVWCAPAGSGRRSLRWASPERSTDLRRAVGVAQGSVAASAVPGSDSGNAALLVSRSWARWRERDGELVGTDASPVAGDATAPTAAVDSRVRRSVVAVAGISGLLCLLTVLA